MMIDTTASRWSATELVVVGTLSVAVLALFVWRADGPSIWYDEIFSIRFAEQDIGGWLQRLRTGEINGGLHHLTMRVLGILPGDTLTILRLPAIVAWVAAIPIFHTIARRLAARWPAVFASAAFALTPLGIRHGIEVRMYSYAAAAALLSTVALIRYAERPSLGRAIAYGLVAGTSLYTHYFVALVLLAHVLWISVSLPLRSLVRTGWPAAVAGVAGLTPLTLIAWRSGGGQISWIPSRSWSEVYEIGAAWIGITDLPVAPMRYLVVLPAVVLLGFGAVVTMSEWRSARTEDSQAPSLELLVLALVAVPVVATFIISWLVQPVLVDRYLIVIVGPVVMLALIGAQAIQRLLPAHGPALAAGTALLAVTAMVPSSIGQLTTSRYEREDWQQVADLIGQGYRPGDLVVTADSSGGRLGREGLSFYLDDPTIVSHIATMSDLDAALDGAGRSPTRVWVVVRVSDISAERGATAIHNRMVGEWTLVDSWHGAISLELLTPAEN